MSKKVAQIKDKEGNNLYKSIIDTDEDFIVRDGVEIPLTEYTDDTTWLTGKNMVVGGEVFYYPTLSPRIPL